MNRSDKSDRNVCPFHRFLKWNGKDPPGEKRRKELGGRPPRLLLDGADILSFLCLNHCQGFDRNGLPLGKSNRCFSWISFCIKGSLFRRTDLSRLFISLFFRNRFNRQDKPSWSPKSFYPTEVDPARLEFSFCQSRHIH